MNQSIRNIKIAPAAKKSRIHLELARLTSGSGQGTSKININLLKHQPPDDFLPMRIPETLEVDLNNMDANLCHQVTLEGKGMLKPGEKQIPLGNNHQVQEADGQNSQENKRCCQIEVEKGTGFQFQLQLDKIGNDKLVDYEHKRPLLVKSFYCKFFSAISIKNVLNTLLQFQTLFSDKATSQAMEQIEKFGQIILSLLTKSMSNISGKILNSAISQFDVHQWVKIARNLADQLDELGYVALESIKGYPIKDWRTGQWELRLSFSGQVVWENGVTNQFEDVILPSIIVPSLLGDVSKVLTGTPFLSAEVSSGFNEQINSFEELADDLVDHIEGSFKAIFNLPEININTTVVNFSDLHLHLSSLSSFIAQGQFDGGFIQKGIYAKLNHISFGFSPHRFSRNDLLLQVLLSNPLCLSETSIPGHISDINLQGSLSLLWKKGVLQLEHGDDLLRFSAVVATNDDFIEHYFHQEKKITASVQSKIEGRLGLDSNGTWKIHWITSGNIDGHFANQLDTIPEFSIKKGELKAKLGCSFENTAHLQVSFSGINQPNVSIASSKSAIKINYADIQLDQFKFWLPSDTLLQIAVKEGKIITSKLERLKVEICWDLQKKPCFLRRGKEKVSILAMGLRQGNVLMEINDLGRISFSGDSAGLYGYKYFNALINPLENPLHALELLRSDEAMFHLISALALFNRELSEVLRAVRIMFLITEKLLKRENIEHPADFIPREKMAKMFSLLFNGGLKNYKRISEQLEKTTLVIDGQVFNPQEILSLFDEELHDLDVENHLEPMVFWLHNLLIPKPIKKANQQQLLPITKEKNAPREVRRLISANQLYQVIKQKISEEVSEKIIKQSVFLTLEQLRYIISGPYKRRWSKKRFSFLYRVLTIKEQVARINESYGGVEFAPQSIWIAGILHEAVGSDFCKQMAGNSTSDRIKKETRPDNTILLGSEEVATLLKASLSFGRQDRQTQLNIRLLLEIMIRQEKPFFIDVLVELWNSSPRAFPGFLFAFFDQDQDYLQHPLDLQGLFQKYLGITVAARKEFMAHGPRAFESYIQALDQVAERIVEKGAFSYFTRKQFAQVARHRTLKGRKNNNRVNTLQQKAVSAIAQADKLGRKIDFRQHSLSGHKEAAQAYQDAFRQCALILKYDPHAFKRPWFKDFWHRNEDALTMLSVVENYRQDVDNVRQWLQIRTGKKEFKNQQHLLENCIQTLYRRKEDQDQVKSDPLVRLLIEPPEGKYNFTIVSCMGVITDGARGRELENSFKRLEEKRGIELIRADTGIVRSLEYNAGVIIQAVRNIDTPWGFIGYSQGCANALEAETRMKGGTPDQQRLLDSFICRNLLFSAANGSPHSSSGIIKIKEAMIEGEHIIKRYQHDFSPRLIDFGLRVVRSILDSRAFFQVSGGAYSLSDERMISLYRDGQFHLRAPTSVIRGITTPDITPEFLEFMHFALDALSNSPEHDTQVLIDDANGRPALVSNADADALGECAIPARPQHIHHWSPLEQNTIEFITTKKDKKKAVYYSPKDRHIFPWIEANARFGLIKTV